MSFGFGTVTIEDYAKHKAGMAGAIVPPSDYLGRCIAVRHQEPGDKGTGAYWVEFLLTDANADTECHSKVVVNRFGYHPDPQTPGHKKMNDITLDGLAQLIEAAGVEPHATPDGAVDMIATLKSLPQLEPTVKFTVSHRTYEGQTYQDLTKFTPAS